VPAARVGATISLFLALRIAHGWARTFVFLDFLWIGYTTRLRRNSNVFLGYGDPMPSRRLDPWDNDGK
jgi:hypothetical protein